MRNPVPLLFVLLGIWIVGGALLWQNNCCTPALTGLSVMDGATTVASNPASNFHFLFSGSEPVAIGTVDDDLKKITTYLNDHPDKYMTIVGRYTNDETNPSAGQAGFANLGLARADQVRQYLVGLGVPADQLYTASKLVDNLSFYDDKTYEAIGWNFDEVAYNISFTDPDNNFKNTYADDFIFPNSSFDYNQPLSAGFKTALGKTGEYLKKNGERSMLITGHHIEGEENTSMLPDLGLARANAIKKVFSEMGVPANQLDITSNLKDLFFFKGQAGGAATYTFSASAKSDNRLAEVEKRLRAQPLILYFGTNRDELNLTTEQRQYLADLIYYLDNKNGGAVNAIGHTDNVGDSSYNYRLSRKRAEFVQNYLTRNNINNQQINTSGKGFDQPASTNQTEEGRAKNRRVVISIK